MVNRDIFSKRLKLLRSNGNLMAKDVANAIEITKQSYSAYESGKGLPTTDKLAELADYFDVSIDYLVGRTNDPLSHKKDTSS